MSTLPPDAALTLAGAGPRMPFAQMPQRLQALVADWLGAPIVSATSQLGGFSPGPAARVVGANGARLFVKAVGAELNPESPQLHRREARVAAALPPEVPAPRLRHVHDDGDVSDGWVVLAFDDVAGQQPVLPWQPEDLQLFITTMAATSAALTPPPAALARHLGTAAEWRVLTTPAWQELAADPPAALDAWSRAHLPVLSETAAHAPRLMAQGPQALLHADLRADNVLLTVEGRMLLVDWPHARIGPAWLDLLLAAASVRMQGGPAPEAQMALHPATATADPAAITAALAAWAGFLTHQSLQPPPPGLPTLRAFQAAQASVARAWLAQRLGMGAPSDDDVSGTHA